MLKRFAVRSQCREAARRKHVGGDVSVCSLYSFLGGLSCDSGGLEEVFLETERAWENPREGNFNDTCSYCEKACDGNRKAPTFLKRSAADE